MALKRYQGRIWTETHIPENDGAPLIEFTNGQMIPPRGLARQVALLRMSPRLIVLAFLFMIVLAIFTARLYRLQVVQAEYWTTRAEEQRGQLVRLPAPRGIIYSRDGTPLVRNVPAYQVVVIPALLPEDDVQRETTLRRLAALLDQPYSRPAGLPGVLEKVELGMETAPYDPVVIADGVDRETALTIAQGQGLTYPGVRVDIVSRRQYPYGPLVSQLVGYLGAIPADETEAYEAEGYDTATDRVGYAGVEASYEDWLRGQAGERYQEEDVLGRVVRVLGAERTPVPGNNVYLTIDLELQRVAQEALQRAMDRVGSRRGVVAAMDPRTGEILAMVSLPTYDDNLFAEGISAQDLEALYNDPHRPLLNHAISDQLPPGSIFKIVTAAAGLQEGVITARTRLNCPGRIELPNRYYPNDPEQAQPFYCWNHAGHGWLDVVGGLANSCDIFFYEVAGGFEDARIEGLGSERLGHYAQLFGLGAPLGIELPGEASGLVPSATWKRRTYGENWSTGDTYIFGIGQGYLLVTPLQMLSVMATTANGGTLYRPQIIHHIADAQGNIIQPFQPEISATLPISPENWSLIHQGLEGAVAYGTAPLARVTGVTVAGKTGTAQFCDDIALQTGICRAGFQQPTHAWFLAYAPAEAPEIALVVFIYNGGEGSSVAAPVAQDILDWYFHERTAAGSLP